MAKTFNCIACGSLLAFEGKTTQTCRHCGANIIVPAQVFHNAASSMESPKAQNLQLQFGSGQLAGVPDGLEVREQVRLISEIGKMLQENRKIEAVKLYRESTGSSLKESLEVVNSLETGSTALFVERTSGSISSTGKEDVPAANSVLALTLFIFLVLAALAGFIIFSI